MGTAESLIDRGTRTRLRRVLIAGTVALAALVVAIQLEPRIAEALDPSVATVTGAVYLDQNQNGSRDAGEPGVADVQVSDGVKIVETDAGGRYSIETDVARRISDVVFITKPAGYSVPSDEYMTPRFYRNLGEVADAAEAQADFALVPDPKGRSDAFTFANVADPHINPNLPAQLAQINATSRSLAFVQVSGDLTNNATDAEFQQYKNGTAASKLPVWPAVGNHEYFNGGAATYQARIENYRRYVGPEWYSFDHGNRHFLILENNGAAPFEEQREWVKQDLERNAPGKRVVVLMHQPMNVPFGSPSQYDAYSELLEQYETELILVGHEHSNDVDRDFVEGAKHIQTNSSSYTIDHSPRGFRYVHMSGRRFDNPFRMYGVERSLTITNPAPGGEVSRWGLDEVQVNAYHTSDAVQEVRYRFDGRGPWRSMRSSGDFTWFADLWPGAVHRRGSHTIEVEAVAEGGARWQRSESFRVTDRAPATVRSGDDWTQYHGDARHSGAAADALAPSSLGLAWIRRTPGTILTGSPVVARGVAYVGTRDENGLENNAVHAVDLKSGRQLWEYHTDSSVHGTPAVADGVVYAPSLRGTLYALDARSGRLRWKREAESPDPPVRRRAYSYYSPAIADGKVFWAYQTRVGKASRGLLVALDPKTGVSEWESPMTGATMSDGTPAVADGVVYVGNETADRIVAYDASTGAQLWVSTARLGGWQDAAPTAVGGRVFIGSGNGVIARDAKTGADLWTYRSPGPSWIPQNATTSAPAVVGDVLYMGFPDGRVTALNVLTGAVVWNVQLPGKAYLGGVLSPPVVSGNTVYVGNNDGRLYGLDRATGGTTWSYEVGTWVASGAAVSGNALVIGAWDGNLYAFAERE